MDEIEKNSNGYWQSIEIDNCPLNNIKNFRKRVNAINMLLFNDIETTDTKILVSKWIDINGTNMESNIIYDAGSNINDWEVCICGHYIRHYCKVKREHEGMVIGTSCIKNFCDDKVIFQNFKNNFKKCKCGKKKIMTNNICKKCYKKEEEKTINIARNLVQGKKDPDRQKELQTQEEEATYLTHMDSWMDKLEKARIHMGFPTPLTF
jgi:hypothetical protein